jgi:hypothetical protein
LLCIVLCSIIKCCPVEQHRNTGSHFLVQQCMSSNYFSKILTRSYLF